MQNVIIVGSGPAGVSASLYTARAGLKTTVLSTGIGALAKAEAIQNYYGFSDLISGNDLSEAGIEGAKKLGVSFKNEQVLGISFTDKFVVETNKNKYLADYVLFATGVARSTPNISGLREFEGRGVSYCAVCDAFFYKGKDVCVLGTGEYAAHEIEVLKSVARSVTLLSNGQKISSEFPDDVKIDQRKISKINGTDKIKEILFEDGGILQTDGLFVAMGIADATSLARKIGAQVNGNKIVVDENMQTTIPGIFAAGDCTGGLLQISKAVYEGAKAGTEIAKNARRKLL